ncbi:MAG: HAD-IIIC family phosphatase [Paracoccaceae bacterium]
MIATLPFGTLFQHLDTTPDGIDEIGFVLPWDICPAIDWRTGAPRADLARADLVANAENVITRIAGRCRDRFLYLAAPIVPMGGNARENRRLATDLRSLAESAGGVVLAADFFSMGSYLASGAPIAGAHLNRAAAALADLMAPDRPIGTGKVLVTDLDNCLWHGIVGEDGPQNVSAAPDGPSFKHFIYQTYLSRMKSRGIILAAVSRNDFDLAQEPLESGTMHLNRSDFVAFEAGYGAKSVALRKIAKTLNLGLDSLVIVDDNPVELAEINASLPMVTTVQFPLGDDDMPALFRRLDELFHRDELTDEDRRRHEFYATRASATERAATAGSVIDFLSGLNMKLTIRTRTPQTWNRAIQLINKTNQFNLNGHRWQPEEIAQILEEGGLLVTGQVADDIGDHGEVLALLLDSQQVVRAFVMSCRVFQRHVEHAFLGALKPLLPTSLRFKYERTERNTPFAMFLDEPAIRVEKEGAECDMLAFVRAHDAHIKLFQIQDNDVAGRS